MADNEVEPDKFIPPFTYNGEAMENIGGYPEIQCLEVNGDGYENLVPPKGAISAIIYCEDEIRANTRTSSDDFPILAGIYFPLSVAQLRGDKEFRMKSVEPGSTAMVNIFYTMLEVRND